MAGEHRFVVAERAGLALDQPGLVLQDRQTGAEARVVPTLGANVVGLRLAARGRPLELLMPAPVGPEPPRGGFGSPVLFPYPNRVRDARYAWAGHEYALPAAPSGHAIHGLVLRAPFRVDGVTASDTAASLRCVLRAADVPALAASYPFAFGLALTYTLGPAGFRTVAEVWNDGDEPLPFGLGFHPYFRQPLVETGRREDCRLQLWASQIWELDADLLPTGQVRPVAGALDPRCYPALGTTGFDTVYACLALDDPGAGSWSSRYLDPAAGVEVVVTADAAFREAVLFALPSRPVLSIEPYTCVTDALNLQARGVDAGLLALAPGEHWVAGYAIGLRAITYAD
jgi:aldose 1-epimerase